MLDKTIVQRFNSAKNFIPPAYSISNLREGLNFYIPIIQAFIKKYEITDTAELKDTLEIFVDEIFDTCSKYSYVDSSIYELQAINSILRDIGFITQNYPLLKDKPNTHTVYTSNLERSKKLALINAIDEVSIIEATAEKIGFTPGMNPKDIDIEGVSPEDAKLFLSLASKILSKKTINDKIIEMLKNQKKGCEDRIKESQISFLEALHRYFRGFGLLESYLAKYQNECISSGTSSLKYDFSTLQFDKDSVGLDDAFCEDYLKSLDAEELCFLSAFWCNRFAKEATRMDKAFSAINSLDLWQDIIDGKAQFSPSESSLVSALQKYTFLSDLLGESFLLHQKYVFTKEVEQGSNFSDSLSRDYTSFYRQVNKQIGEAYASHFSKELHSDNNFLMDSIFSAPFTNLRTFAYYKKDTTLVPIVKGLLANPHLKNWGIIRNEFLDNGVFVDSVAQGPKVLLGFDVEGFNRPFRFHMKKDDLMDILKCQGNGYTFPEYQGSQDFIVNNRLLKSSIIMPIPKRHRPIIREGTKNGPNKDLWEHLYFLTNGKFPPHLMQETPSTSNGKPILSRQPVIYTDLRTGKRYTKKQNNYVEVGEDNVR
jgi:hypothetical protein